MEILLEYKKQFPQLLSKLPLPKRIAEELGVPIRDGVVSLNEYMKDFQSINFMGLPDSYETKVACEVKPSEGPLIPADYVPTQPGRIDVLAETEEDLSDMPELEPDSTPALEPAVELPDYLKKAIEKAESEAH